MSRPVHDVVLTDRAAADLAQIHAYLAAQASLDDADRVLDKIMARIDALAEYPDRGNVPKELDELGITRFRQLTSGNYRLFYRSEDNTVYIVLVADGRRDMRRLLQQRLLRS